MAATGLMRNSWSPGVIATAMAGQLWLSLGECAQTATRALPETVSEARLFGIRSAAAWPMVQRRLSELGLSTDKLDRANHVALTKWRDVATGAKGMEWMPALAAPEPYVIERVRFLVFVSPFAEPARVYISSLMEARGRQAARATVYNVPDINRALMAELAKSFGEDGVPIPPDREQRRQLALSFLKDEADDCLRQGRARQGAGVKAPQKIPLSEFEVVYPAGALQESKEGTVHVEFTITEDGGVTNVRHVGPSIGYQLEASAIGAASLLLYTPAELHGCRVPTLMSYVVRYRHR